MSLWYFFSVYLHILFAALWIGGMLFLPLVLLPGIRQHPDRIALLYKTGLQFRFYGWIALTALLVTGLANIHLRGLPFTGAFFLHSDYGRLVCWKLLVFAAILVVSGAHDFMFGRKALEDFQASENKNFKLLARWSGRVNLLLSLVMAFLGVVLSRGGSF